MYSSGRGAMYPNIPQSSMGGSSYGTPMSQPYDNQSYQQQQPQQQPQQPWQVSGAQQNHSQNQYGGNQQQNQLMHSQQTQPQQQGYGQVPQQQQFQQSTSQNSPIPQNQQAGQSVLRRPAQIPTKANDEDPKYGPLGRARQAVQRGLIMDDEVTVDLLPAVQAASGQASYGFPPSLQRGNYNPLHTVRDLQLPPALLEEIKTKQQGGQMGLFEAIERAWFTVDNKLYLWDYNSNSADDFQRYDQQKSTIVCVALAPVKRGILIDDITHVLIICTSAEATIFGVTTKGKSIEVYSTGLTAALASPVTSIVSTDGGRLFMLALDGDIYELNYGTTPGSWLTMTSERTTASVVCKSRSSYPMVPSMLTARSPNDRYTSITADPSRGNLFAQKANGGIDFFKVSGNEWQQYGQTCTGFLNQIRTDARSVQDDYRKAVKIAPVLQEQSSHLILVIISGFGHRYYLSANNFTSPSYAALTQVIDRVPQGQIQDQHGNVQQDEVTDFGPASFYTSGIFIGVPSADDKNRLKVYTSFNGTRTAARENARAHPNNNINENAAQEWISTTDMPSSVWTIAEIPANSPATYPSYLRTENIAMSSLATQTRRLKRKLVILSRSSLRIVEVQFPVDGLAAELDIDKTQAIQIAGLTFGKVQLAAMGVLIGSSNDFRQADLGSALHSILNDGGAPQLDSNTSAAVWFSDRHEGLVLQLARYLRPIWSAPVVAPVGQGLLGLAVPQTTLQTVQHNLQGLSRYLAETSYLGGHQYQDQVKAAWEAEEASVAALRLLVDHTVEAISFVLLLADYKMPEILARCPPETRDSFSRQAWSEFLTSTAGRSVAKVLVNVLIEQQIGQQIGIETLSEILQQRCGSFCQPGDVVQYKAEECIRRAEGSRDPYERRESLEESLRLYKRAAKDMTIPKLQDVTKRYRNLDFVTGAIDLSLYCAAEFDPDHKAEDFKQDDMHQNDPRRREWELRQECYACVVEALGALDDAYEQSATNGNGEGAGQKRSEAYNRAEHSDDELFHYYLYDWIVSRGRPDDLLDLYTPYIIGYLEQTASNVEHRRDLLWKYHARRDEHLEAARALYNLATQASSMSLMDRQYYLSTAIISAKSANASGSDDVQFVTSLEERKEVADVQLDVMRAIESHNDIESDIKDQCLQRLDNELVNLDELYQEYARPCRLYESILLILKTANTRLDEVCDAVWKQLLVDANAKANALGVPNAQVVGEKLIDLLRRFYPSEGAPIDIVIPAVYLITMEIAGPAGWTTTAMLRGGFSMRDLWDSLLHAYDTGTPDEMEAYGPELGALVEQWISHRDQVPAADVDRVARQYLLQTDSAQAGELVQTTRRRFAAARTAIGR